MEVGTRQVNEAAGTGARHRGSSQRAAVLAGLLLAGACVLPAAAQDAVSTLPGVTVTASRNPGETPVEAAYTTTMATRLGKGARYPTGRDVSLSCPSGTATVWVELVRSGKVVGHGLESPSGSQLLDQQAVQLATRHKYAPLPADAWNDGPKHRFQVSYAFDCAAASKARPAHAK